MTVKPLKKEESKDYKDPKLPVNNRVADLLGRMTLEEKVDQMIGVWGKKNAILVYENGRFQFEEFVKHYPHGIGQIGRLSDPTQFFYYSFYKRVERI